MSVDISKSEFRYDPDDEIGEGMRAKKLERKPKADGYAFYDGRLILIIVHSKYLESPSFYTHEFTEITLIKIFHEIAQEDDISYEGICWLNSVAHELSPYGKNKMI